MDERDAGCPKGHVMRNTYLTIRCTRDERDAWHKLAEARGENLSEMLKNHLRNLEESSTADGSAVEPKKPD